MGGTRATTMQSIQVHLSGAARSWMTKLPEGSIDSWKNFENLYVQNFKSTCKKRASIEQLRTCTQKSGESMRAYIQRWSLIKNSAEHVSDERAIDAFIEGIRRKDLVEELGRANPRTVAELMETANRWVDGEKKDDVHNKRQCSTEENRNNN
jgi:mevalonate kinase